MIVVSVKFKGDAWRERGYRCYDMPGVEEHEGDENPENIG